MVISEKERKKVKKIEYIRWILWLLPFAAVCIGLLILPDKVPMHWNSQGEADRIGSKWELLLIPIMALIPEAIAYYCVKAGRHQVKIFSPEMMDKLALLSTGIVSILFFIVAGSSIYAAWAETAEHTKSYPWININQLLFGMLGLPAIAAGAALLGLLVKKKLHPHSEAERRGYLAGSMGLIILGVILLLGNLFIWSEKDCTWISICILIIGGIFIGVVSAIGYITAEKK